MTILQAQSTVQIAKYDFKNTWLLAHTVEGEGECAEVKV